MTESAYRRVAADLRASIAAGAHPVGSVLPKIEQIAEQHGVSKETAGKAVALLQSEGLVHAVRRRGTVVREQVARQRLVRTRTVYRDERGYFFDPVAKPWVGLRIARPAWAPAPADVAALLGIDPLTDCLVRDRVIGEADTRAPMQLATTFLHPQIARGTVLEQVDTGVGGIYDRIEQDLDLGTLSWEEAYGARMPSREEAKDLGIPVTVPLLRILRTAATPDGMVVEVNDTRMSSERFEIGGGLTRDPSAARPDAR